MEFSFGPIWKAITLDKQGFHIFDTKQNSQYPRATLQNNYRNSSRLGQQNDILGKYQSSNKQPIQEVIDTMGQLSSTAQGLKATITTYDKIIAQDNRLYLKAEDNKVLGFIKVGKKNLFFRDIRGSIKEINCLCVLDFYCHETVQRQGVGKQLFEKMLENEKVVPSKLGYDRPSHKFLGFLKKHYGLSNYIPQNSNFVIFQDYFENTINSSYTYNAQQDKKENLQNEPKNNYHQLQKNQILSPLNQKNSEDQKFSQIGRNVLGNTKNFGDQITVSNNKPLELDSLNGNMTNSNQNQVKNSTPTVQGIRKERGARSQSKKKVTFKENADIVNDEKIAKQLINNIDKNDSPKNSQIQGKQEEDSIQNLQQQLKKGIQTTGFGMNNLNNNPNNQSQNQQTFLAPKLNYHQLQKQKNQKPPLLPSLSNNNNKNNISNGQFQQNQRHSIGPTITTHNQNSTTGFTKQNSMNNSNQNNNNSNNNQKNEKPNFNNTYDNPRTMSQQLGASKFNNDQLQNINNHNQRMNAQLPPRIQQKKNDIQSNIQKTESEISKVQEKLNQIKRGRELGNTNVINRPFQQISTSLGHKNQSNNNIFPDNNQLTINPISKTPSKVQAPWDQGPQNFSASKQSFGRSNYTQGSYKF